MSNWEATPSAANVDKLWNYTGLLADVVATLAVGNSRLKHDAQVASLRSDELFESSNPVFVRYVPMRVVTRSMGRRLKVSISLRMNLAMLF